MCLCVPPCHARLCSRVAACFTLSSIHCQAHKPVDTLGAPASAQCSVLSAQCSVRCIQRKRWTSDLLSTTLELIAKCEVDAICMMAHGTCTMLMPQVDAICTMLHVRGGIKGGCAMQVRLTRCTEVQVKAQHCVLRALHECSTPDTLPSCFTRDPWPAHPLTQVSIWAASSAVTGEPPSMPLNVWWRYAARRRRRRGAWSGWRYACE